MDNDLVNRWVSITITWISQICIIMLIVFDIDNKIMEQEMKLPAGNKQDVIFS